jgi:membrane-bound ClpP family serine protease
MVLGILSGLMTAILALIVFRAVNKSKRDKYLTLVSGAYLTIILLALYFLEFILGLLNSDSIVLALELLVGLIFSYFAFFIGEE